MFTGLAQQGLQKGLVIALAGFATGAKAEGRRAALDPHQPQGTQWSMQPPTWAPCPPICDGAALFRHDKASSADGERLRCPTSSAVSPPAISALPRAGKLPRGGVWCGGQDRHCTSRAPRTCGFAAPAGRTSFVAGLHRRIAWLCHAYESHQRQYLSDAPEASAMRCRADRLFGGAGPGLPLAMGNDQIQTRRSLMAPSAQRKGISSYPPS